MPELPEVETVKRTLAPSVEGLRIESVVFHWPRTCVGDSDQTAARLAGQLIERIDRHGKYLVFRLSKGGRGSVLVVHLRMTGNLLLDVEPGSHTRAEMFLEGGRRLVFHDTRKFGKWQWSTEMPKRLDALGPEPLEIEPDAFAERLAKRSMRLKSLLLDQEFLRGLGNIYADEALFRARLHPERSGSSVSRRKALDLHAAIQAVLEESIALGGTTITNFVNGKGVRGHFQLRVQVYRKTGEPCPNCTTPLRRILVGQRSTHYCPRCQRL